MSVHSYDGDGFRVTWDKAACIHAAVCVKGLPQVFDVQRKPWVDTGGADAVAIEAQVRQCPSGALGFHRLDAAPSVPDSATE